MSLEERSIAKNNAKKAELAKLQAELLEVNVNLKVLNKKRNETKFVAFLYYLFFLYSSSFEIRYLPVFSRSVRHSGISSSGYLSIKRSVSKVKFPL